jgi:hypothetical protein
LNWRSGHGHFLCPKRRQVQDRYFSVGWAAREAINSLFEKYFPRSSFA